MITKPKLAFLAVLLGCTLLGIAENHAPSALQNVLIAMPPIPQPQIKNIKIFVISHEINNVKEKEAEINKWMTEDGGRDVVETHVIQQNEKTTMIIYHYLIQQTISAQASASKDHAE